MSFSICVQCGSSKREPWQQCRECGTDPQKDDELLVKSVYLSLGRFDDTDEHARYRQQLTDIARGIRDGEAPQFDDAELARLRTQKSLVESVPLPAVFGALFRLFFPAFAFLLILFGLVALLRSLK